MTQAKLVKLTALWQKRLRLSDWIVTVELLPKSDQPDFIGQTHPEAEEMRARITVMDGEEAEVVATLIHELLHIRLFPLWDGDDASPTHMESEIAINLLASCFLTAYTRRKHTPKVALHVPPADISDLSGLGPAIVIG